MVGINAQIYSNSGGFQGVSFAIPINVAVQIKDQIVKTGKVEHSRLGVEVQTLNQSLADSFKLNSPNGALVAKVVPDSAAARSRHQGGRCHPEIQRHADRRCRSAVRAGRHRGTGRQGDDSRSGATARPLTLTATIGNASAAVTADDDVTGSSAPERLGLALRPLNPEERQQAGVPGGLVVEDAQGRAAEAGIQPGDVVLSVDGTPVQTVAQLRKMVQEHDKQIALLIQRGDSRLFFPVTLG